VKPLTFMLIAGEPSGDLLASELVRALRVESSEAGWGLTTDAQPLKAGLEPRFIGAGGPQMAAAGVELAFDLTAHAVIGVSDVLKNIGKFRRLFHELLNLAVQRQPDAIVCVDFGGFNRRFGHAAKAYTRAHRGWFHDWDPKLIQLVSPQVWASRAGRAYSMARDFDLLLSIFPFEKAWYAQRVPEFRVEFVGHPMVDRFSPATVPSADLSPSAVPASPRVVLLPGSRPAELRRHLPVMLGALTLIRVAFPQVTASMVLPHQRLLDQAQAVGLPPELQARVGGLAAELERADLAIAKTGTTTMECAFFGVPTVALYKETLLTYQVGRRIVKVKYLSMPNILADAPIFPEFIQNAATPENLAGAAIELLRDPRRRAEVKVRLAGIVASLGGPGAARRGAQAIMRLLG